MLENYVKKFDNLSEEENEKVVKRIIRGANLAVGAGAGTIDVLTTGMPCLSIGLPAYDALNRLSSIPVAKAHGIDPWMFVDDKKEFIKNLGMNRLVYGLGASIPFIVKYYGEIINFVYQMEDKLL